MNGVGEFDVDGSDERRREGIPLGGEEGIVDGTDEGRMEGIPLGGIEGIADALGEADALGALLTLGTKD